MLGGRTSAIARIDGEVVVGRPVHEVFDFVADERNEPLYNRRIVRVEKTSAGPIGGGDTVPGGGQKDVNGTLSFDPVSGGTRLRWEWDLRLRGVAAPLTPLAGWFGRGQEKRNWSDLKRFLEGQAASSSAGAS